MKKKKKIRGKQISEIEPENMYENEKKSVATLN